MTEREKMSAREKLWAKETAESWNISTRVLMTVAIKGSFFDERNPRLSLFRKLEDLIANEDLRKLEGSGREVKSASELRVLAGEYNQRYLALFLESFLPSELKVVGVSSTGVVLPSRELEENARA